MGKLNFRSNRLAVALLLTITILIMTTSITLAKTTDPVVRPIATPGKVMLLGGAMEDGNADVYLALKAATGKTDPKIAVICSASPSYTDAVHEWSIDDPGSISYQHLFELYGFQPIFIPVALDNYTVESYNPLNVIAINSCDAVFFNGGWQERHTRCMYEDDGTETPVMVAVRALYQRGGVIAGTSAGCAVQGAMTYGDGNSYGYLKANHLIPKLISDVNTADPKNKNNGGFVKGLGFTAPYNALCDSHFEAQGRFARPLVAMRDIGAKMAFGVDENTGLLLDDDTGKVYGVGGVTIFDASTAAYGTAQYFTVSGVMVSYLTAGDSYTFSARTVQSAKPVVVNPTGTALSSASIFGSYEASRVMASLVRSASASVKGTSAEKNPRFTVTFAKDSQTRGYFEAATGKVTIEKVKISIYYSAK